jgi:hypothetical protein
VERCSVRRHQLIELLAAARHHDTSLAEALLATVEPSVAWLRGYRRLLGEVAGVLPEAGRLRRVNGNFP